MSKTFEQKAGISLLIFTILLLFTMVFHPAGGSIEHIMSITGLIVTTHAIAIFSLPFGCMGFWGLTRRIGSNHFGAVLAFIIMAFGLVAVMLAAATNGLILPIFLQHYKDATPEVLATLKPVTRYSFAINHAFDYIYTGACCLAILCWSVVIIFTKKLPVWLGWLGIAVAVISAAFIGGMAVNTLQGLRFFITSIVIWILLVGVALCKKQPGTPN